MMSLILRTATRILLPLMILYSLFLLIQGHNEPGGGFVGGLLAAAALSLYAIAYNVDAARAMLRVQPHTLIGTGLLFAVGSGVYSMTRGAPFLTAQWAHISLGELPDLDVGTPLIFDLGVYVVVVGITVLIVFSLVEE